MSIVAIDCVFRNRRLNPAGKLVMLAIANFADDQGGRSWPSFRLIHELTGLSERTIQRTINDLENHKELIIFRAGKRGPGNSHRYQIPLENIDMVSGTDRASDTDILSENIDMVSEKYGHGVTLSVNNRSNRQKKEPDAIWLQDLAGNAAYRGIDVELQFAKATVWAETNGRTCTRRFFVNWLNNAKPIEVTNGKYIKSTSERDKSAARTVNAERLADEIESMDEDTVAKIFGDDRANDPKGYLTR